MGDLLFICFCLRVQPTGRTRRLCIFLICFRSAPGLLVFWDPREIQIISDPGVVLSVWWNWCETRILVRLSGFKRVNVDL